MLAFQLVGITVGKHSKAKHWFPKQNTQTSPQLPRIKKMTSPAAASTSMSVSTISNAKLWATLCYDSATLISADIVSTFPLQVHAVWSQRDVVASKKRVFAMTYTQGPNKTFVSSSPVEVSDPSYPDHYYSPSRKRYLKFATKRKAGNSGSNSDSITIEIWQVGWGLEQCWEIDAATHGPVYTDEWFGSVSWSPDEKMVVYVADRPISVPEGASSKDPLEAWQSPLERKFEEKARDPFGEAYINKRSPTLFIADLEGSKSYPVCDHTGKEELLFGEPQWSPNGKFIVATMRRSPFIDADLPGTKAFEPNDVGLRYCYNRYSAIVAFDAPKSTEDLKNSTVSMRQISSETDLDDFCCYSPRFSLHGYHVFYLSYPRKKEDIAENRVLPHNGAKVLRYAFVSTEKASDPDTLVSVPEKTMADGYQGLYLHGLPKNPWLNQNSFLLTTTQGPVNYIEAMEVLWPDGPCAEIVEMRTMRNLSVLFPFLSFQESKGLYLIESSVTLLDIRDRTVLFSVTNPAHPTQLFSVDLMNCDVHEGILLHPAQAVSTLSYRADNLQRYMRAREKINLVSSEADESFSGKARRFEVQNHKAHERFQVTILLPVKKEEKSPLIVFPHGGPHVVTLSAYSQGAMALLQRGFAVMYVNYRGSTGFGQKSLESLPGNVGTQEVNEVVQATRWAVAEEKYHLDPERIGFLGGSHSGFIGAHTSLIPGLFKRTVLRNPVVNIASMVGATDIPDWCFCETALSASNRNGLNLGTDPEQLRIMYEHSPVSRVKRRQCASQRPGPTLLQVGGSDRRVPPQQSLEWKRIMTEAYGSNSVFIRWYPKSGHAIDEVPEGDDAWVHALDFLCEL